MNFLVLLGLISCASLCYARPRFIRSHTIETIQKYGYEYKNYSVKTEDGYYLDLVRIPHGLNNNQKSNEPKPVVLLMHNYLSSSDDFVFAGPESSLGFYLAEQGYDVFMGNTRGNKYGRNHTTLDPERDAAFWNFCWSEIGTKDLPAIIDYILEKTNQQQIYYVGHMQGSTIFYVMASEKPAYNQKIIKMASLGPLAYLSHANSALMQNIVQNMDSKAWVMKNVGKNEFTPSKDLINTSGAQECMGRGVDEKICKNVYFLLFGYDTKYFNMTTVDSASVYVPAGGSIKQLLHYAKIAKTGKFMKDYEGDSNNEYDLSKVTTPVAMYYVQDDFIAPELDVNTLKAKLPNVVEEYKFQQLSDSIDFLYANNVNQHVFNKIAQFFKQN